MAYLGGLGYDFASNFFGDGSNESGGGVSDLINQGTNLLNGSSGSSAGSSTGPSTTDKVVSSLTDIAKSITNALIYKNLNQYPAGDGSYYPVQASAGPDLLTWGLIGGVVILGVVMLKKKRK